MNQQYLAKNQFYQLIQALRDHGYAVLGPQVRDKAIVYEHIDKPEQFPIGVSDTQAPGQYILNETPNGNWFAWANGPQALKPLVFASQERLWSAHRSDSHDIQFEQTLPDVTPTAIIGVRACDLAALKIQDQHFLEQTYQDPYYQKRRQALLLIAVNCSHPASTCFCVATGDGPEARAHYDLVLTELADGFLVLPGSDKGQTICASLDLEPMTASQQQQQQTQLTQAIEQQKRSLPEVELQCKLLNALEHPHWDDIAKRCLACGNCTAVCPTCFCHSEHDQPATSLSSTEHVRQWDSCFNHEHSYIHGIVIRSESKTRYRQWLTHKFASWHEQYGRSGCVGCGRCISWCPVGIDVTTELAVLCGDICE